MHFVPNFSLINMTLLEQIFKSKDIFNTYDTYFQTTFQKVLPLYTHNEV